MFRSSADYTTGKMQKAIKEMASYGSDMGGTNIHGALEALLKMPGHKTHTRNVFLLTDGAVGNPEGVIDLVKKNNHNVRFHAFGVGSGASTYLVKETAKAGFGTSHMVQDNDTTLNAKVIESLSKACTPAFTGIEIDWGIPKEAILFQTPTTQYMDNVFEGELF